ncbi:MAG: homoserine kinase, partial [Acidobacteriota bacterium]
TVRAPATVSNVVCGFDCLGFALERPFDELTLRKIAGPPKVRIINRDQFGLPEAPEKNVAGVTLLAMLDAANVDFAFELESAKQIKPGSGIGSSAASACGAAVAANALLDNRYNAGELIEFALEGEKLASGARHADNVAPCILGGFILVRSSSPLDIVQLSFPKIYAAVIHPQIEIKTAEARNVLPENVPLATAVRNWANLGALVASLASGDLELLSRSLEDEIVEPTRSHLIPKFAELKNASLASGALGGGISGSGPSVFMLTADLDTAGRVEKEMRTVYSATGIEFCTYVSEISSFGAAVV